MKRIGQTPAADMQTVLNRLTTGTANNAGLPDTLANIVLAQAQHESANFSSPVFQNTSNAYGYKYAGSQYETGQYEGYAVYPDVDSSAAEIVDYIYRRVADGSFPEDLSTITTADQYAELLQNAAPGPYYEDTEANYAAGIQSYLNQDQASSLLIFNPWIIGGIAAVVLVSVIIVALSGKKKKRTG